MNDMEAIADTVVCLQSEWTSLWHERPTPPKTDPLLAVIEQNHRENFGLWHEEDVARRDDLGSERVHQAKRAIDRFNQARNDAIEQLDECFLRRLPPMNGSSPLHSETPGMIVDRLSIMGLKAYHMKIESVRESADAEHRRRCSEKLARLEEQIRDLQNCLQELLNQLLAGTRRFKIYRQMKMYNNASLNPQLYVKNG